MKEHLLFFGAVGLLYINIIGSFDVNLCSDAAAKANLPVVTFCKNSSGFGTSIVVDGYYMNAIGDKKCECKTYSDQDGYILFEQLSTVQIPFQPESYCGSTVEVIPESKTTFIRMECFVAERIVVKSGDKITIAIVKQNSNADTRYCIQMHSDQNITIACSTNDSEHSTSSPTDGTFTDIYANTNEYRFNLSSTTEKATNETTLNVFYKNDKAVYFAIGFGCGAVLIWILITLVVIYKRHSSSSQKTDKEKTRNKDDSNEGIQRNPLYRTRSNCSTA